MTGNLKRNDRRVDTLLDQGIQLHQTGQLDAAKAHYESVLRLSPRHFDALHFLGIVAAQTQNPQEAERLIARALQVNPNAAIAQANHGNTLLELGRPQEALLSYDKAIALAPDHAEAFNHRGQALQALGRLEEALASFDRAIALAPGYAEALNGQGNALRLLRRWQEALSSYEQAIALRPDDPETLNNRGVCLQDLGRFEEALDSYARALALRPHHPDALNNRGTCLEELGRMDEALRSYDQALSLRPDYAEALNNRGNLLQHLRQFEAAVRAYDAAIAIAPTFLEAHHNRANALQGLMQFEEALQSYGRIIAITPHDAAVRYNQGNALYGLRRYPEALESYDRAIAIKPDYAEAFFACGKALQDLKHLEEALAYFEKAVELKPNCDFWSGTVWHLRMQLCRWEGFDPWIQSLRAAVQGGRRVVYPFELLGMLDEPDVHLKAAQFYSAIYPSRPHSEPRRPRREKIRVGYFSMDFREHPIAYLIGELIERHDRSKFEIYGFSFGGDPGGAMRQQLEAAFDEFLDVRGMSAMDIAQLSRQHEIDIAVDLGGHTQASRPQIFAQRAAPIQINYLGYPGTFGNECMDYLVGDATVITEENQRYFSEKTIILPHQFQVNPRGRPISGGHGEKRPYGLPEDSFVFCCFNNSWKITPEGLGRWARILNQASSSVLWLHASSAATKNNLKRAFQERGVDPGRIIFADRVSRQDYLEQYKSADLFLDTLPYNAGTTASDALWMGLPVLTLAGKSFAGRMAASLLNSIGLSELIAQSAAQYESLAIELASNADKLARIKAKLASNRSTSPLFDTALFAQHIEAAYRIAYDRHHAGLAPDHITVLP